MLLIAYFFAIIISIEEGPILIGPYKDYSDCASVEEFLTKRGYETETCSILPLPQDSITLQVGYIP